MTIDARGFSLITIAMFIAASSASYIAIRARTRRSNSVNTVDQIEIPRAVRIWAYCIFIASVVTLALNLTIGNSIPRYSNTADASGGEVFVSAPIPGQLPGEPQQIGNSPTTGQCLSMEGPPDNAVIHVLDCSDPRATLKIVGVAPRPSGCVSDVDQHYFQSKVMPPWALCMDYNWQKDRCISVDYVTGEVRNVGCHEKREKDARIFKPTAVYYDVQGGRAPECSLPQLTHTERKYAICVEVK